MRWGSRDHLEMEFVDKTVPVGVSYYYLRVQQVMDGERVNAWSSPIWVTKSESSSSTPSADK
jgi:hypothetical protein